MDLWASASLRKPAFHISFTIRGLALLQTAEPPPAPAPSACTSTAAAIRPSLPPCAPDTIAFDTSTTALRPAKTNQHDFQMAAGAQAVSAVISRRQEKLFASGPMVNPSTALSTNDYPVCSGFPPPRRALPYTTYDVSRCEQSAHVYGLDLAYTVVAIHSFNCFDSFFWPIHAPHICPSFALWRSAIFLAHSQSQSLFPLNIPLTRCAEDSRPPVHDLAQTCPSQTIYPRTLPVCSCPSQP